MPDDSEVDNVAEVVPTPELSLKAVLAEGAAPTAAQTPLPGGQAPEAVVDGDGEAFGALLERELQTLGADPATLAEPQLRLAEPAPPTVAVDVELPFAGKELPPPGGADTPDAPEVLPVASLLPRPADGSTGNAGVPGVSSPVSSRQPVAGAPPPTAPAAASTPTAPGPATADAAGSPAASAEDPGPRADGGLAERAARTPVVAEPQVPGAASASASAGEARRELSQPALPTVSLPHAPGSSRWADGLGERVAWMLDTRNHVAELRLTPPELGRLDVRIAVSGSEASIQFSAPSAAVREAVDAALPRLREMLEADGLSLAHADVSDHGQDTAGRRAAPEDGPAPRSGTGGEGGDAADPHAVTLVPLARAGLIDHYA